MNLTPDVSIYAVKLVSQSPALSMTKGPPLAENFPKHGELVITMKAVIAPELLTVFPRYQNRKHSRNSIQWNFVSPITDTLLLHIYS